MSAEDATKRKSRVVAGRRREGRPARWADAHVPLLAICLALTRIGFVGEKIISAFGWDSRYLQVGVGVSDVSGACETSRSGGFPLGIRDGSARALDPCLDVPPRRRHPVRKRHAPQRLCGRPIASAHRVRGRTNPKRLRFCAIAQTGAVQHRSFELVDAADDFRQSPSCAMPIPDWLEHGDEAKKHAGDSSFLV